MKRHGIVLIIIALSLSGIAMRQPASQPTFSSDPTANIASDSILPNLFGASSTAAASAVHAAAKQVATPAFLPPAGTYSSAQSVKIHDATAGSTIYYTTNGTTPTTSSTKYKTAIKVAKTETIRAIAVASGHTESAVAKAGYTLSNSLKVLVATAGGKGVVTVQVGGESAFAVLAKNQGKLADPSITVSTSVDPASLPVEITLCETNPNTGQCLAAPKRSVVLSSIPSGAERTFSVFVQTSKSIANDPSKNRINVLFKNSGGAVEASGSVAVTTE